MLNFLLVHGSWHDGSMWQPVIDALELRGHAARAVTLAGHGKGVDKAVSHDDCVQSVLDFASRHDLRDIAKIRSVPFFARLRHALSVQALENHLYVMFSAHPLKIAS